VSSSLAERARDGHQVTAGAAPAALWRPIAKSGARRPSRPRAAR